MTTPSSKSPHPLFSDPLFRHRDLAIPWFAVYPPPTSAVPSTLPCIQLVFNKCQLKEQY